MKIFYVTSEAGPYAASGGLGDVMGALPPEIKKLDNCEVSVILPLYSTTRDRYADSLQHVTDISFKLSWRETGASIFKIENKGVDYYFVENHYYFDREGLYGYGDDAERFAFFSMAVIEFIKNTGNIPDIIHANDWQSALTVIYLKTKYSLDAELSKIKTLYTIHNIEYQGKFGMEILGDVFALDDCYKSVVEHDSCVNLMKGAMVTSDFVSTVSPNYANELKYDYFGFGLSEIIKSASDKMFGIINGIDYNYFSPEHGGDIDFPFKKTAYKRNKAKNKAAFQQSLGLPVRADVPLLVMITRLASQKGIDLLLCIARELLSLDIQFVILGTGDRDYENSLVSLEKEFSNMRALIKFDRVISKKMYASADIFLMPSKFEPCGLAQMISCAYATVPVVRAVGGLYDSITPYGMENSNGFNFTNYNAHEFLYAIKTAIDVYKDKNEWAALTDRAIKTDFSWSNSAKEYVSIYKKMITNRN